MKSKKEEVEGKESLAEVNFQYTDRISFSEGKNSIIEVLKVGKIQERGLDITEDMLEDFVKNFNENAYGTDVQVNLRHDRAGEAAGWIKKLIKEGGKLLAEVEWTPLGLEKIKSKQFRFTSSELAFTHVHPDTGKKIKNVLIGVALTNIPAVKGMNPVTLSEQAQNYILTLNNMDELKQLFADLKAKEELTKEDVKAFAESEHFSEDSKEAAEMLSELQGLVKEEKAPAKEIKKEVKKEEKLNEEGKYVELSEYQKLQEAHAELSAKVEFKELCEDLNETMTLSESVKVGFAPNDVESVAKFMTCLSQEQRGEFKEIISKVQNVDLSTIGTSVSNKAKKQTNTEDSIVELAEKKMQEARENGVDLGIVEAQKLAAAELSEK